MSENLFDAFESTEKIKDLLDFKNPRLKILGLDHDIILYKAHKGGVPDGYVMKGNKSIYMSDKHKTEIILQYVTEVFSYYKKIIEEIEELDIDKVTRVVEDKVFYEISGAKMEMSSELINNYLNGSEEKVNTVTVTEEYLEDLIKVTVKTAKAKETKIIKDKLKKLIDEL